MKILNVKGYEIKVDDDLYLLLKSKKWHIVHRGTKYVADGYGKYMHRLIMGVTDGNIFVDHIDRDTFNNQRSNLRLCTRTENLYNRNPRGNGKSIYLGVNPQGFSKKRNKITSWMARITVERKPLYLGAFKSEVEAAKAYDEAAKKYRGEFASLNFPDTY